MRKIWKKYFEDLLNIDTQEQVVVNICGFDGIREVTTAEESQLEELRLR